MIVASDLEGTLTTGATWVGMESYLRAHGRARAYRWFYASRIPSFLLQRVGVISGERFKNAWIEGLLRFFKGQTPEAFGEVAEWVVEEEMWPQRRSDVIDELQAHVRTGRRVILTSGTYEAIAEQFAARAGLPEVIATPVGVVDGRLTGKVGATNNTGAQKAANLVERLGGEPLSIAYGDTLPDVPMMEASETAVAVYPDEALAPIARERGWRIMDGR